MKFYNKEFLLRQSIGSYNTEVTGVY